MKNVTGQNLGRSVQNVVTVAAAFTIAFVFGSLKMALVLLGVLPLMVAGSFAQMRALRTNTDKSQQSIAQAGGVAVQAITGIRTVTAFNMSPKLLALYSAALRKPMLLGIRNAILRGLTLGLSQFVTLSAYGLLFWYDSAHYLSRLVGGRSTGACLIVLRCMLHPNNPPTSQKTTGTAPPSCSTRPPRTGAGPSSGCSARSWPSPCRRRASGT